MKVEIMWKTELFEASALFLFLALLIVLVLLAAGENTRRDIFGGILSATLATAIFCGWRYPLDLFSGNNFLSASAMLTVAAFAAVILEYLFKEVIDGEGKALLH